MLLRIFGKLFGRATDAAHRPGRSNRSVEPLSDVRFAEQLRPQEGTIEHYWFENEHVGLERTRFHRITIPLEPIDSGLDYLDQPEQTSICIEWIKLSLEDPSKLHGIDLSMGDPATFEASVYLGYAHNWIQLDRLSIRADGDRFNVTCVGYVDFEHEGVAKNEPIEFTTSARYRGAGR